MAFVDGVVLPDTPEAEEFLASFPTIVDSRFNKAHDKLGKFSSKSGGLTETQWTAITPGRGKTAAVAHAELEKTNEGRALLNTIEGWQDNTPKCKALQENFMKAVSGKAGKLSSMQQLEAKVLMDGISGAPVSPALYRGSRFPAGQIGTLVPGKSMILPPSSFTSSNRIAGGFAKQATIRKVAPVVFRVPKGARALPVEVFGMSKYKNEKEWISAGQFTITKVTKRSDGVMVVDVDHTAMFQWRGGANEDTS